MSNEVKIELTASEAKLVAGLRRGETAIKAYGARSLTVLKRVNDSIVRGYDKLGALAPLGIGVGLVELSKNVREFDDTLSRMRRSGGYTKNDMAALRTQILGLTQTIPVTKSQFADMAKELNDTGLSLDVIKTILPQVGKGAKAAGADTSIYAATVGELLDKYKVAASDLPALQDQMAAAMKFKDVRKSPEQFLQSLQGLSKTMQLMKSGGMGNVTPLMALMAQLTSFTGSSSEAAGSLEALFTGLLRISHNKVINDQLKARGINFFDAKGGIKNINDLMPELHKFGEELKKSGKSAEEGAMAVFGRPESAKAVMIMLDKYDAVKQKEEELRKSSGAMGKDYSDAQETMAAKLVKFQNQIDKFNTEHMSAALQKIGSVLDYLNAHPIISKGLMTAILGAGGLVMLNKVAGAFSGLKGLFSGKGAAGIAGGLASKVSGGMPVFVTNMPGGGFSGMGGTDRGLGTRDIDLSRTGAAAWGVASIPLAIAAGSYGVSRVLQQESAGLRKWRAENSYDYARSQEVMGGKPAQNNIQMTVHINMDQIKTDTNDLNTKIAVKRGDFKIGQ